MNNWVDSSKSSLALSYHNKTTMWFNEGILQFQIYGSASIKVLFEKALSLKAKHWTKLNHK